MEIIGFLVIFPLLTAASLLVVRSERARTAIVVAAAAIIMVASLALAVLYLPAEPVFFSLNAVLGGDSAGATDAASAAASTAASHSAALAPATLVTWFLTAVSALICLYIIVKAARANKPFALFLAGLQLVLVLVLEFGVGHEVAISYDLYIDRFSVIMALIIGIIGSGICIYALGYMRDFQHHAEAHPARPVPGSPDAPALATAAAGTPAAPARPQDRRPLFFALMFLFLSAMFLIVFANNLSWLLSGWEVTTVCSFALIGYTRTREASDNAFRQIVMNLAGGLAFCVGLIILVGSAGVLELDKLIAIGSTAEGLPLVALPVMLVAFAGFTKAAQMPFQSWLLGAMVAPTPTSALLHSSTMVKAGVFILIKLAPTFGWNASGMTVVLVGGLTFLFCSGLAISQSNAKRVLAYSTVANLGLIVACAGVGTPEAVWAAIFLLLFHAAAKSLLFCCVGTAEHHIGSRDIEDMDQLFVRMPRLALLMALGMLAMFIAPFGMLVSKWATIVSLVDTGNITLLFILAFGSALTFMFWAKWLGKVLAVAQGGANLEKTVHPSEWFALALMAVLSVGCSLGFPWLSQLVVEPYLGGVAAALGDAAPITAAALAAAAGDASATIGSPATNSAWSPTADFAAISFDNLLIMALLAAVLLLVLLFVLLQSRRTTGNDTVYLSGVGRDFEKRDFINSLSGTSSAEQRNWYMQAWFGESVLTPVANIVCIAIVIIGFALVYLGIGGVL
ncbi:MAG: hypothetical protein LBP28_04620 [Coriobacteriales bacterium]|nr:hypothetical protein [Coriobacteriales bacterium]